MSEANELRNPTKQPPAEQHKGVTDILGDAVHSALYTAVQEPVSGVTQIVDQLAGTKFLPKVQFLDAPVQAKFGTADWHAQQVGSAVGMLLPFLLVGKGVKGVLGSSEEASMMARQTTLATEETSLLSSKAFGMSIKEAGLTGFTYDAFLRPSDTSNTGNSKLKFLLDRGTQGAIGAGTFMTLTAGSAGLSRFAGSAAIEKSALVPLLKNPIISGAISGIPAGLFSSEANSITKTGKLASATDLGQSVYGMSLIGGGFGAVHALGVPGENGAPSKIDALKTQLRGAFDSTTAPKLGLSLASGDKVGPDGAEHSVSADGTNKGVPETTTTGNGDGTTGGTGNGDGTNKVALTGDGIKTDVPAVTETGDAPFDNTVTDASLQDLAKAWGATFTPEKAKTSTRRAATKSTGVAETGTDTTNTAGTETTTGTDKTKAAIVPPPEVDATKTAVPPTEVDATKTAVPQPDGDATKTAIVTEVTSTTGAGGTGSLDLLPKDNKVDTTVLNPDLRDATADSAVSSDRVPDATAKKRTIKLPDVEVARHEDLTTGIKTLNEVLKSQFEATSTQNKAIVAEARARNPLASADVVQAATEATQRADEAKRTYEQQRKAFSDYVGEKGVGLQTHLQEVARQLKHPDVAREIVDHDYAVTEGKSLLTAATADGATPEQQAALETFIREKGQNIRPELQKIGEEVKNSDIARALLEHAYSPREISVQVDDVGQQAAMNVGIKVLTQPGGIDQAVLNKYAQDYGPAMEKHMRSAADQLGFGADAKLKIGEAYHGEAFKQGVDLLKAVPIDPAALKAFAENGGKTLEQPMAQAAIDLGLDAPAQLKVREAYRGVESWVKVQGVDDQYVAVKPEQEDAFRMGIELVKASYENNAPAGYIDFVRNWMKSPDNEGLKEPLRQYAELSGDPHMQAFVRELEFPTDNMTVSGKPASIQLGDLLGGTTPEAIEKQNRFQDFSDLTQALRDAPDTEMAQKRQDVFNWLNRNEDLHDAALRVGEQSADSRVVGALDSYFGTKNLNQFIEAKAKYDKVAAEITPELINRMHQPGGELFWELAPPALETPRMWGGSENISTSKQALRVQTLDDGSVVADFNPDRNPDKVAQVTDSPDGTRTVKYSDGGQLIQMPQGYDVDVKADGSWRTQFANGNYIIENAPGNNVAKVVYENGAETTLFSDGEVRRTGVEDQTASKWSDGTVPGADSIRPDDQTTIDAIKQSGREYSKYVTSLTEKLSSDNYAEASVAAIQLKNSFGNMTDTQFVQWLNFALGSHPDTFGGSGRSIPNWPDLHMRADGQVLLQDQVQTMLRGGDTPEQQQSAEGQQRAYENRTIIRQFLNAPEMRPSDLQYPAWLVKENLLPAENLPENVLKDLRVRFTADQRPADVNKYLEENPDRVQKPKPGDKRPPRGPYSLPKDDLPSRLRVMSDVLQYAPKDIQEQLLRLGSEDGRALRDVMQVVTPPKGPRDKAQPEEFKELLDLTVPQAQDIYTVRLMIQAVKDAAFSKDPATQEKNEYLAIKAAQQLLPEDAAAQARIMEIISGISTGKIRAPWVPDGAERPDPENPSVGGQTGQILRDEGLRTGEQYADEDESAQQDGSDDNYANSQLSGSRGDFDLSDWQETQEPDPNHDPLFDSPDLDIHDANNAEGIHSVDDGIGDGSGL